MQFVEICLPSLCYYMRLQIMTNLSNCYALLLFVKLFVLTSSPSSLCRGVDPGGGGGGKHIVLPPAPNNLNKLEKCIICIARIGLKCSERHYKSIKFKLKILLNIHNFQFCCALRAQHFILQICARIAPNILAFFSALAPPPPPPIRKLIDARVSLYCFCFT